MKGRCLLAKRIFIADDHESVLRRVRGIIESHPGWNVCGDAVNGREAITKATQLKPDLVVLDFAMPRLDGLKAASEIKALLPGVPIVMFTMYGSSVKQEAEKHGISRLVDKSRAETLIAAIEELLEQNPESPTPMSVLDRDRKPKIKPPTIRKAG
jgi:DNA-binding NarL/FixJ family response regulator